MTFDKRAANWVRWLWLALLLMATSADARWKPEFADNPNKNWFEAQRDCNGLPCCGVSDGEPYYGGYELLSDGSVQLDDGTHINACQVLHGPNPTGHAIRWMLHRRTYCFAPGSGS